MTTPAHVMESVTLDTLRRMAEEGVFQAVGDHRTRSIKPGAIVLRDTRSDRGENARAGERRLLRPGLLVVYLGTTLPLPAGQTAQDDGVHVLIVELIDDAPTVETNNRESYHYWMNTIRKKLQENPYRNEIATSIADFWQVHVTLITPFSSESYRHHQEMRLGLQVTAHVREPRS